MPSPDPSPAPPAESPLTASHHSHAQLVERYADGRARLRLTWLMAALSMLGPFSIDTYLPAFPAMQAALPASETQMQLSLTVYFIGFAIASLFHGAISDAVGRRPVVIATLAIHAAASVGCALSPSIGALLAFRAIQGCFAGAGFVVGRAVVRDLFPGDEAQRQLARVQMLFALAPIVAPILGGWLVAHQSWQSIFWCLAAYGALLALWSHLALPETHPDHLRLSLAVAPLARTYRRMLFDRRFLLLGAVPGINFIGFFTYIAGAPAFLMRHLGLSSKDFAVLFIPGIIGITAAAWWSGRLAGRIAPRRHVRWGFTVMAVAALVNLVISSVWPTPLVASPVSSLSAGAGDVPYAALAAYILPIATYTFGMALVTPVLTIKLLDAFAAARGSVSALQSSTHVALMAFTTALVVPFAQQSLPRFALTMLLSVTAGALVWHFYLRSHPDSP
ncbi:MAG: multidrug effflux MFS transporter [Burkholderiales bacterium]|nr:multidrug effflux MFS transporter [Burkholderiales bacterium]